MLRYADNTVLIIEPAIHDDLNLERKREMNLLGAPLFSDHQPLEMDKVFKTTIGPWWDYIDPYYQQIQEETTWKALPPVITAAFKYLGCDEHSLTFINIYRMAYFAGYIHTTVQDVEEGQEHDRKMQFSVLIGDLLFGRLLQLLVEADKKKIMMPFAAMICTINEGRVMKHKMNAGAETAVEKIYASLYETIFLSAAVIAGREKEFRDMYRRLGLNLGMAIELTNVPDLQNKADKYQTAARDIFKQINQQSRLQNSMLEKLIKLVSPSNDNGKTVAI